MDDRLAKLTLEELWQLFPIKLSPPNPDWSHWYADMAKQIQEALGKGIVRLSHIGSTAVPDLLAKPTIDLLLEVHETVGFDQIEAKLKPLGFFYDTQRNTRKIPVMFKKGYTIHGYEDKVYHLHIRNPGDWSELYFRDFLREFSDFRDAYAALKKDLLAQYMFDRNRYTDEKTSFIQDVTTKARQRYKNRYAL